MSEKDSKQSVIESLELASGVLSTVVNTGKVTVQLLKEDAPLAHESVAKIFKMVTQLAVHVPDVISSAELSSLIKELDEAAKELALSKDED